MLSCLFEGWDTWNGHPLLRNWPASTCLFSGSSRLLQSHPLLSPVNPGPKVPSQGTLNPDLVSAPATTAPLSLAQQLGLSCSLAFARLLSALQGVRITSTIATLAYLTLDAWHPLSSRPLCQSLLSLTPFESKAFGERQAVSRQGGQQLLRSPMRHVAPPLSCWQLLMHPGFLTPVPFAVMLSPQSLEFPAGCLGLPVCPAADTTHFRTCPSFHSQCSSVSVLTHEGMETLEMRSNRVLKTPL